MKFYDIQAPLCDQMQEDFSDWKGGNNFSDGRILACGSDHVHKRL